LIDAIVELRRDDASQFGSVGLFFRRDPIDEILCAKMSSNN
jgi:hypothetical protein